jgi:hypothetical protein
MNSETNRILPILLVARSFISCVCVNIYPSIEHHCKYRGSSCKSDNQTLHRLPGVQHPGELEKVILLLLLLLHSAGVV